MLDHVGGEEDVVEDADGGGDGEPECDDAGAEAECAPCGELIWAKGVTAAPAAQVDQKCQHADEGEKRRETPSVQDGVAGMFNKNCLRKLKLILNKNIPKQINIKYKCLLVYTLI